MNTTDPDSLCRQHLAWLNVRNYSPRTVADREHSLKHFIAWLKGRGLYSPAGLNRSVLEAYVRFWAEHRKSDGEVLSANTRRVRVIPAKTFCRWLARTGVIANDPTTGLESTRLPQSLPKCVLSHAEARRVLEGPVVGRRNGLRDRAMLEVFYSTGIRRSELAQLRLESVESDRGLLMVRRGKGGKDRLIPIGASAVAWIKRYLAELRPNHVRLEQDPGNLFLTERGSAISPKHLTTIIGQYVRRSNVGKNGSCHLFRHTMATLMLENGADIRYLQEQLGHASLQTTQIYTRVSVRRLKEVHETTHPAEIGSWENPIELDLKT